MKTVRCLCSLLCVAAMGCATGNFSSVKTQRAELEETIVFQEKTDGYAAYRIPALLVSPKGALLAFCEGRKTGLRDDGDIDLVMRRSEDGGKTWGPLQVIFEEGGNQPITIGNPCPVVDASTGIIWMPFCRNNRDVFMTQSADDGLTWSQPVDITAQANPAGWAWYATGPGVGIQLQAGPHTGRLVIPCDHNVDREVDATRGSHVLFSDDHGKTWQLGGALEPRMDECQAAEIPGSGGAIMMNMRSYAGQGCRAVSISQDGGETWEPIRHDPALIEPVCQGSIISFSKRDGYSAGLAFSNPASTKRDHMTVRISEDGGTTWPIAKTLYPGPSAYSCLTGLPDGTLGCLYERGIKHRYETIVFARFSRAWVMQ